MIKRELKNVQWSLLIIAIILSIIGVVALFSATQETNHEEFTKQLIWFGVSFIILLIMMFIDYEILLKISPILYGISIILLIAVLFTPKINGASSWFDIGGFSFQPSEFAKPAVILFLTFVIDRIQRNYKEDISRPTRVLLVLFVLAIPLLLILKQPDLGTAMAFVIATTLMIIVAGIDKKYIIVGVLLIAIGVTLLVVPATRKMLLPEHAQKRIEIYLNPESDPRGAGYNIIQSKLAIGAGQLTGMGYLKGNQTQLGFLYPKTTDFIFSVIGEEMGFLVAATIIILYVLFVTGALYVAKTAKDGAGTLIATGISGIFLFHMIENIGMVMGLLPITGVPLAFISYGGSSLITNFICVAILLNISSKRQKTIFVGG